MLAVIRLIGRENAESPDFKVYTEPYEFKHIILDLQKYGVNMQTIHGAAFVAKQSCNDIIQRRGDLKKDVVAKNLFEGVMNIPIRSVVCRHQADMMGRLMNAMALGHTDFTHFGVDWVMNRKIERLKLVYGLLF